MHIEPALPRFQLSYTGDGTRVLIPARRNWFILLFLCAWMGGWVMGETSALAQLAHGGDAGSGGFLYVWLALWTAGGAFALLSILWQLCGQEVLSVSDGTLTYRVEIAGLGRSRSYATSQITRLRTTEFDCSVFGNQGVAKLPFFGPMTGPLVFDHGSSTIRLAPSLDEAEARLLLVQLQQLLPANMFV